MEVREIEVKPVVIACFHDCFITSDCLGNLKFSVEAEKNSMWSNNFWAVDESKHEQFWDFIPS